MIERPVILFDGVCHLCNGFVRFVLRRDAAGVFDFAPLQSEYALRRLGGLSSQSVVLLEAGQVYFAEVAALRILSRLQAPWPLLARAAGMLPRWLLASVYRLVAKYRYRVFGRSESCMLPPPGSQGRFK